MIQAMMSGRERWTNVLGSPGAAIGAALLIVAVGLCLVHAVDDDGMSTDLCAAMLASFAVVLFVGLVIKGSLPPDSILAVLPVSIHLPDPPPRSRLS